MLWWDRDARQLPADALGSVVAAAGLTCYACAVLRDHDHLLIRNRRWKGEDMSATFKAAGRKAMLGLGESLAGYPVFSADCCPICKSPPAEVRTCIDYITGNNVRHHLAPASVPWRAPYDGRPLRGKQAAPNGKPAPETGPR